MTTMIDPVAAKTLFDADDAQGIADLLDIDDAVYCVAVDNLDSDSVAEVAAEEYLCSDGNGEWSLAAASTEEAAKEFAAALDASESTYWVSVTVMRQVWCVDADGAVAARRVVVDAHKITVEAREPTCTEDAHDWQSPHEVVGGLEENPGIHGHGGGVTIHEVCAHCGCHRHVDTWAQDPSDGEQGLTSTSYSDGSED